MHQCLTIVEVQHAIFSEVRGGYLSILNPEGLATLARLARTCRIFSNAALDILWEDLGSFASLIQCLPPNLWKIDQTSKRLTFQRSMSPSDWEIFFRYSSRVRSISAFSYGEPCKSLDSVAIFSLSRPPHYSPLVPHLKTLRWANSDKKYEPLLQLLLTHSLVDVTLPCFALRSPITSMQLTSRCPLLKRLCIENFAIESFSLEDILDAFSHSIALETVLRLPHTLETLECYTLDEAAIAYLSRFSSLTNLALELQDDLDLEDLGPHMTPGPTFESLESLSLTANALPILSSFLELMHFKPREVSFTAEGSPTTDMFHQFFTALAQACDPERLSRIFLNLTYDQDHWLPGADRHEISLSTFQSLLVFPNVETISLDAMCNISLDDDAIAALAKYWPRLSYLVLNPFSGWGTGSRITHWGLITLLSGCTKLDHFALAVDFSEIDQPCSQLPDDGIISSCGTACFIESEIKHPATIAAFLGRICPELYDVGSYHSRDEDITKYKKWDEVKDLLLTPYDK